MGRTRKGPLLIIKALQLFGFTNFSKCLDIERFAVLLPWLSPVLNAVLYSFIGKRFRSNLTKLFKTQDQIRMSIQMSTRSRQSETERLSRMSSLRTPNSIH